MHGHYSDDADDGGRWYRRRMYILCDDDEAPPGLRYLGWIVDEALFPPRCCKQSKLVWTTETLLAMLELRENEAEYGTSSQPSPLPHCDLLDVYGAGVHRGRHHDVFPVLYLNLLNLRRTITLERLSEM